MNAAEPMARMDTASRLCLLLVLCLAAYFAVNAGMIYATLDFGTDGLGRSEAADFFAFYSSARLLHAGAEVTDLYDTARLLDFQLSLGFQGTTAHAFGYPPTYAYLIWPLGALPYAVALICWQWGTLALFAASLRLAGLSAFETLAAAVAPAAAINFAAGQNGFLTSALLISGMALFARRPIAAGGLFGLLTIKPHLGLLVPIACLAGRRWLAATAAALAAAGLAGLSVLAAGAEAWAAYLDFLVCFQAEARTQVDGPYLTLSATPAMGAQVAGLSKSLAIPIQAVVSGYVAGAVYLAFQRRSETQGDPMLRLCLLLVGASLATPYAHLYDLTFVGAAVVLLARRGLRDGFLPYEGLCLLSAFVMPFLGGTLNQAGLPLVPVVHLALFLYVQARLRRRPGAVPGLGAAAHPAAPGR